LSATENLASTSESGSTIASRAANRAREVGQTVAVAARAASILALKKVSRTYGTGAGAFHAVHDVSLDIATGSFVTIVGASGSGKSTLLHLMGALDTPTEGEVLFGGQDLARMNDDQRTRVRRDRIGFVFQFFNLLPTLTAIENVELPARLARRPRAETSLRAEELLSRVGLGGRRNHRPDQLSGGEMQRVAIARGLMMRPALLLADEPTGNLDSTTGALVLEQLQEVADASCTVVLVTHDPSVAGRGTRRLVMGDGRLIGDEASS
jgi:putative ABC transport system ATP-binding protein